MKHLPDEKTIKKPNLLTADGKEKNKFICPRCGEFNTNFTTGLKRHFNSKKMCQPFLNDIALTTDVYNKVVKQKFYA